MPPGGSSWKVWLFWGFVIIFAALIPEIIKQLPIKDTLETLWNNDIKVIEKTYRDGRKCQAQSRSGKLNGIGNCIWQNGDEYSGEFNNDLRDGIGTYKWAATSDVYQGEWKNDLQNGKGVLTRTNGSKITGIWVSGRLVRIIQQSP